MNVLLSLPRRSRRALLLYLLAAATLAPFAHAQERENALSDAEIEKLRDTAYYPPDRITAFIDFLDLRTKRIDKLTAGKRQPGREEDIHDLMEQFTSIADDLDDNLEDYSQHHRDIRKVLPKLVAASERWGTALKTPPEHESYNVARKLALETLADIHEAATKMIDEQKAWFLAHPPPKDDGARPTPR
jgi:hypothetical protein